MAKGLSFTPEQQEVIDYRGGDLLVSAAAGSGKTTVMIQRVCDLIVKNKVPINKFLIISFTKASATDMKNKLIKKLSSLEPTPFILEQMDDILTSDVSNLHSFCARLLKSYFYEVSLDPSFIVLDDSEVEICKEKALIKLFNQKSECGNKAFYDLIDIFSKSRKDTGLKNAILKLYNFLCSITDRENWFKNNIERLYNKDLTKNTAAKLLNSHMMAERSRCEEKIKNMIDRCLNLGQTKLVAYLQSLESMVMLIRYDSGFYENAKRLALKERLPNIPKAEEGMEELTEEVKSLKEEIVSRFDKLKEYSCLDEIDNIKEHLLVTKERIENLYNLTLEFEEIFTQLKREKGGLDFNDLEQYSLKVLSNEIIHEEIKNKYDYVLVDEYQDINGVQEELLRLLSRGDNRFMVGDVKQSIYRFRLCDPEIFLNKYNLYQDEQNPGKLILLNANFRSKSGVLDFVNAIFDKTMTQEFGGVDYKGEARLKAGSDTQKDESKRVGLLFADTGRLDLKTEEEIKLYSVKEDYENNQSLEKQGLAEGLMVAEKIADLIAHEKIKDSETGKMRKIRFSDITILTLSRTAFLNKLTQTLESKGIPVSTDIEDDCFDDEYIYGLRCFIETIACFKVDYSLFSCMYSKVFGFTADELAQIKLAGGGNDFYYQNVESAVNNNLLDSSIQQKLEKFLKTIYEYRQKAQFMSVKDIVKQIVDKQKVKVRMSFEVDSQRRLQKLNRFCSSLGEQNVFDYLSDTALASVSCEPVQTGTAVNVMTIHKSKGLEFGVVFVVGANRGFNFKSLYSDVLISKDYGVCIDYYDCEKRYKSPTIAKQAIKLVETRKMLEEEQRLLYVALTRATDYLYIVGSGSYEKIKKEMPISPTCFMDFMGDLFINPNKYNELNYDVTIADAADLIDALEETNERQVLISDYDDEGIKNIKSVFDKDYRYKESIIIPMKSAVTALVQDDIEKKNFDYFNIDDNTSSLEKGTIQHKVMQWLTLKEETAFDVNLKIKELKELGIITEEELSQIMIDGIVKLLNNKNFRILIESSEKILKEREFYLNYSADNIVKQANKQDQVVIQGIVDLCLITKEGLVIIDYKTGNLNSYKIDKYSKQLNIYAEAMSRSFESPVVGKYIASLNTGELINI